ncbi:MAG: hypothetical protein ACREC6_13315, partial [Hyphomicrobiaceae bacterium]
MQRAAKSSVQRRTGVRIDFASRAVSIASVVTIFVGTLQVHAAQAESQKSVRVIDRLEAIYVFRNCLSIMNQSECSNIKNVATQNASNEYS